MLPSRPKEANHDGLVAWRTRSLLPVKQPIRPKNITMYVALNDLRRSHITHMVDGFGYNFIKMPDGQWVVQRRIPLEETRRQRMFFSQSSSRTGIGEKPDGRRTLWMTVTKTNAPDADASDWACLDCGDKNATEYFYEGSLYFSIALNAHVVTATQVNEWFDNLMPSFPEETSFILAIFTSADNDLLEKYYGSDESDIDWTKLAHHFDGIVIRPGGIGRYGPAWYDHGGWDVPTMCFWGHQEHIEALSIPIYRKAIRHNDDGTCSISVY